MHMPKPNILLAIADDLSWPHLSAYGCRFVNSPHTDRVAREDVLFHNCFTTAPTCTASRGSLLTGLYPWQLEEAGYFIGLTNKGWGPGSIAASGRTRNPAGPSFDDHRCTSLTSCMNSNDYSTNFKAFMDQNPTASHSVSGMARRNRNRKYEKGSGLKHGKRSHDEFYTAAEGPDCIKNMAGDPDQEQVAGLRDACLMPFAHRAIPVWQAAAGCSIVSRISGNPLWTKTGSPTGNITTTRNDSSPMANNRLASTPRESGQSGRESVEVQGHELMTACSWTTVIRRTSPNDRSIDLE